MIVVKIGGGKGINVDNVLEDIVNYKDYVLVHGGSDELNRISEKLGNPPKFVKSVSGYTSRYTNRETLGIFEMIYSGKINKEIVEKLQSLGVNAIGLSGLDGRLLEGKRKSTIKIIENEKKKVLRDDYTGKVEKVNLTLLKMLLKNGYVPVVAPLAISYEHEAINVDGDRAASAIAVALKAETLIILSNVPGLLKDVNDSNSLIKEIPKESIDEFMQYAKKRMKKKVLGAKEAIDSGIKKVIFGSANVENPIENALKGNGTVIE